MQLIFSFKNQKLKRKRQAIFDLPAGHSCPFALTCYAYAIKETGRLIDGDWQLVRCYAASAECAFPPARRNRWHNFDLLRGKTRSEMFERISADLPKDVDIVRVHSSGDYFNEFYFLAWMDVANRFPNVLFYSYTKAIPFWLNHRKDIPANFHLNASYGGRYDALIAPHGLKSVTIVNSEDEARSLNLEIDHDDFHAWAQRKSFALLIHGNGPKGSLQAKLHNAKIRGKR